MKWKLGRFAGINVFVHWSFWILPAFVLLSTFVDTGFGAAVNAVIVLFSAFTCVVLHEYGHALTARAFGVGTRDITLYPIGGVASLERIPRNPLHELAIAAAGPAVNVVIAGILAVALLLSQGVGEVTASSLTSGPLVTLLAVNVMLVVFNLLPAFPMDGGRILRALLAMPLPHETATTCAARIGQAVAVLLAIACLGLGLSPGLLLIAGFVFIAAQAELTAVRRQAAYERNVFDPVATQSGWAVQPSWAGHRTAASAAQDEIIWIEEAQPVAASDSDDIRIVRYGYWRPR